MKVSTLVISVLIISAMMTGIYGFVNELSGSNGYNVAVNQEFLSNFSRTNALSTDILEQFNKTQQEWNAADESIIANAKFMVNAMSLVLNIILLPFNTGSEYLQLFFTYLGAPAWVFSFALAVFVTILLFAIVSVIVRWYS